MGRKRRLAVATITLAALAVVAMPVMGQSSGHEVSIETPDQVTTGDNEIRVVVDNSNGDNVLFSPLVEVALGSSLSAPDPAPQVEFPDGSVENRTYEILNSSYRSGEALFVYGEEVPAGEIREYVFTLQIDQAGNRTIEADVRPLYNESNNARTSTTVEASPTGTLDIDVLEGSTETVISDATVTVDGTDRTGGDLSLEVVEGEHTVTASGGGTDFPTLSPSVSAFSTQPVTFTHYDSPTDPAVIANSSLAEVVEGSSQETILDPGNATTVRRHEVSFRLDANGETTVVAVPDPAAVSPPQSTSESVTGGTLNGTTRTDGETWLTIETDGVADVTVTYVGSPAGDGDGDGTVDATDATAAAQSAVDPSTTSMYADVDGDGAVTAIDAMIIQQYAAGNRTADYALAGGGS